MLTIKIISFFLQIEFASKKLNHVLHFLGHLQAHSNENFLSVFAITFLIGKSLGSVKFCSVE